ncbi:hypothetical protein HMPREF9628_00065 [Peptoanaerobacter stomatis]|uniref:Aldehyde oxidase/xanthine dehydrogenase a/b hammerhead domain-containing protein n=1 Tax=Peptoanaerobacter stomatis TaxID=796937 RepID=G9X9X4_9FIRM|nr:xanthine dehydrogenase subunit XdhA [Peptoanaerobacter stomatis]EHL20220.1 hypothetical protein HMPREF9628_00065 [Peptoanaerobacter stomatis]
MIVGKKVARVDAYDKVTGVAQYTEDIVVSNCLVAKLVRSTIANGKVLSIDIEEAMKVKGVVKIFTCFDVPDIQFPTAGHPWSVEASHQDISDRKLLNERVRYYGDEIAAVVARDEVSAKRAVAKVKVEYEEYPPLLDIDSALDENATVLHEEVRPTNTIVKSNYKVGEINFDDLKDEKDLVYFDKKYSTQTVQHCHIELPVSKAYGENGKITVISSTQIPHITRRVCGQALGIPWGKIRIIKPYIGGGFGNKQDVLYEPLNAWLCQQLGGKSVEILISREETFTSTRTRHAIQGHFRAYITKTGRLIGRKFYGKADNGAYAAHGHAIMANCGNLVRMLYQDEKVLEGTAHTVYTNRATAGAMRGYGIPQACFMQESFMDDMAYSLGIDPISIREQNMMKLGYVDLSTITCHSTGLQECIDIGKKYINWDEKRKALGKEPLNKRRGVGMAIFCYKTGVYPISLETATARISLNQDGSVQLQMGATEIGQGADTAFSQMAAETIGISLENVHIVSFQDTDVTPFDTGAYASRQTYVSGGAIKKTAESFKRKVLDRAGRILNLLPENLDIKDDYIVLKRDGTRKMSMHDFAMEAIYSLKESQHITACETYDCKNNTYSFGATFAEVEVDCYFGKIKVLDVINIHDSGKLINPQLAEAQVHGGMSMALGYVLGENYIYDDKGKLLNGNLLDYKMPTSMDHPDFHVEFVQTDDPSGAYGNKSLGEPPTLTLAPAVRNAVLHATGIGINSLPLNPQKLIEEFKKNGLIE